MAGNDPANPGVDPGEPAPVDQAADPNKPADPKEGDKKEGDPAPFDTSKLTFPEGIDKDSPVVADFAKVAGELGLTPDGANKLLGLHAQVLKEAGTAAYKAYEQTQTKWVDEVKADKELGGDNLPKVQQTISRALEAYGNADEVKAVREALAYTGAGNNPAVIRTIYRLAKAVTEGSAVTGTPAGQQSAKGASAMYPHLKEA